MKRNKNQQAFPSAVIPLLLSVFLFASLLFPHPAVARASADQEAAAELPLALLEIGEEAFAGTALAQVSFQEHLLSVGDRAFAENPRLTDVYIPSSVQFIGESAFPADVLLHGEENSYVMTWAEENGYQFVVDEGSRVKALPDGFHVEQLLILICIALLLDEKKVISVCRRITMFVESKRPQDRIELYPINYRFP